MHWLQDCKTSSLNCYGIYNALQFVTPIYRRHTLSFAQNRSDFRFTDLTPCLAVQAGSLQTQKHRNVFSLARSLHPCCSISRSLPAGRRSLWGIGRPVCRPGRFGVIWERQEIIKTDLTKDAADKLAKV